MINPIVSNLAFALGSTLTKLLMISAHVSRASRYCTLLPMLVTNLGGFELSDDVPAWQIPVLSGMSIRCSRLARVRDLFDVRTSIGVVMSDFQEISSKMIQLPKRVFALTDYFYQNRSRQLATEY